MKGWPWLLSGWFGGAFVVLLPLTTCRGELHRDDVDYDYYIVASFSS